MSSVAVPKKMVPVPNVYGVESFKEIKPEMVALHPIQHKNTVFTSSGTNRISFKIPAYSNALLDTSRSFLHLRLSSAKVDDCALAQGMPIFERMVVKTSSGLTLEDVSDMDILSHMLSFVKPDSHELQSLYGNKIEQKDGVGASAGILGGSANGAHARSEAILKFDWGIFDKKLTKFIPLFMADGGAGYSFDVDLYVSDRGSAVIADNPVLGTGTTGQIQIENPVWYLQLMRMDEGLARRFNQMAVSGEEIRIPFHTYHTHNASAQATDQIVYIHENATNFKKIITCLHKAGQPLIRYDDNNDVSHNGMGGGVSGGSFSYIDANSEEQEVTPASYLPVTSYNYRVGVQHVYNEPVMEVDSNTRTLMFVKQAFGVPDEVRTGLEISEIDGDPIAEDRVRVFDKYRWMSVASFDYSPADADVVQGISSSNPVQLDIKFGATPTGFNILNFCELGYDLVFRGGAVHYEEQKPGSQSVY
jgi:hypothetical protein